MSKNTVIDEWLGEIPYHDTFDLDGEECRVVDFDKLPHYNPVDPDYRYVFYGSNSQWLWTGDQKEVAIKDLKEMMRKVEEHSLFIDYIFNRKKIRV